MAESSIAENSSTIPPKLNQRSSDQVVVFFTAEAKASTTTIKGYLPQAIIEFVACVKHFGYIIFYTPNCQSRFVHGKSHIRGAPNTGTKWYFVVVDLDADGNGAKYWVSELIKWWWKTKRGPITRERFVEESSSEFDPVLVVGILSLWSLSEFNINDDQWFVRRPGGGRS